MIIRTILNFSGLYAAIQLLAVTITHVFNLEIPSGAQIGLLMGAAYGAMMISVSRLKRAPTRSENWILSVAVNVCALIISAALVTAVLYLVVGAYAYQGFMMVLGDIPIAVFLVSMGGTFLLQVAFCLLVFGKAARRHLLKVQTRQESAVV